MTLSFNPGRSEQSNQMVGVYPHPPAYPTTVPTLVLTFLSRKLSFRKSDKFEKD